MSARRPEEPQDATPRVASRGDLAYHHLIVNFSADALLAASPKDAARLLYEAGRDLRGKNLRRGSWLEIAHALQSQRAQQLLLPRLQAAVTREDALRVLRLARKWARPDSSKPAKQYEGGVTMLTMAIETCASLRVSPPPPASHQRPTTGVVQHLPDT